VSGACEFEPNYSRQQDDVEEPENKKLFDVYEAYMGK